MNYIKPDTPFVTPIPGGLSTYDSLKFLINLSNDSQIDITLNASDEEKIDSRVPLKLNVSNEGIIVQAGKNKIWEVEKKINQEISVGKLAFLAIHCDEKNYRIGINGQTFETFDHHFPSSVIEYLAIDVSKGAAEIDSISYTKEMCWIGTRIGQALPKNILTCGQEADGSVVYLGRTLKNNTLLVIKVIPDKKKAVVALNGKEYPVYDFEVLQDNNYYAWKDIEGGNFPERAVTVGNDDSYIGRMKYKNSVVPGNVSKSNCTISVAFDGKEIKSSSKFQVLVVQTPTEVQQKLKSGSFESESDKPLVPVQKENKCIICFTDDYNSAFVPCGHMCLCYSCAEEHLKKDKSCPICRQSVTSILKLYAAT